MFGLINFELIFFSSANKYNVKLSEDSYRLLKDFVKMKSSKQFIELMKENIMLECNSFNFLDKIAK